MNGRFLAAALLLLGMGAPSAAARAQGRPGPAGPVVEGIWDLTWQTRSGPRQRGYLMMRVEGAQLVGEIHGQGAVTARGALSGARFHLSGRRMLVRYRIDGRVSGDRLEGRLKVLSVERQFTGIRRTR